MKSHQTAIDLVVRKLVPNESQIDELASGRDDYRSQLALRVFLATLSFRNHKRQLGEDGFVRRSIWNERKTIQRRRHYREKLNTQREPPRFLRERLHYPDDLDVKIDVESLVSKLSSKDQSILNRLYANDGSIRATYDQSVDHSFYEFRKRVHKLREKTREILDLER